jgi:SagB-type dehydrogenase family enzyme
MGKIKRAGRYSIAVILVGVILLAGMLLGGEKGQEDKMSTGERFHKETGLTWAGVIGDAFGAKPKKPEEFKVYKGAEKMELPKPEYRGVTVEEAIDRRRSVRDYSNKAITKAQLSQLLFSAQGTTGSSFGKGLRAAPSAGALYPFEVYVVVNNVEDLPRGIYHYSVRDHTLEVVKKGDFREQIADAGLKQGMLGEAGVTFVLSAIFDRVCCKYGQRGYRYVYMEAGHISQNIYLESVSLGLGSVCAGAFLDEKVNELIGVDGRSEAAIYLHAVGTL